MTSAIGPSQTSALSNTQSAAFTQTPTEIVKDLIAQNSDKLGRINYSALARDLDSAKANFPELSAAIERETSSQLGPRAMAKLENAVYSITAPDGSKLTISRNAPSIESYYKGTAHAVDAKTPEQRAANRKSDLAHYAKLDRIFGDGNVKTFDGPKIQAGIDEALRTGSSFEKTAKNIAARETAAANADSKAATELAKDLGQLALDVVGIFDPTPTADLVNAGISAWRGDGWGAFLSVISAVPYIGDAAKLGKLGNWAKTIANAVELAAKNPAMRAMLEPALRKVSDLIGALPKAAFNALPDSAKTALLEMKGKIDDLLRKSGPPNLDEIKAKLAEAFKLAPAAKQEIDALADGIVARLGGQVAKAPIKSEARALEKALEYGGDVSRIKDLARNTIVINGDKIDDVVAELQKSGAQIKRIDGAADPLGYSGINATIKTKSGLVAEIQVNSPKMIYAKESPANARAILGDAVYNKIAKEVGVPGGEGHKLYEQYRSLPARHPERANIEKASRAYYDMFR